MNKTLFLNVGYILSLLAIGFMIGRLLVPPEKIIIEKTVVEWRG